jgi:hypothetical protein
MKCKNCFDPTGRKFARYCTPCLKWRTRERMRAHDRKRYRKNPARKQAAITYYWKNKEKILQQKKGYYKLKKLKKIHEITTRNLYPVSGSRY